MFERSGLGIPAAPRPLKKALITTQFINQAGQEATSDYEVTAPQKYLTNSHPRSRSVLPPPARSFIIIPAFRNNGADSGNDWALNKVYGEEGEIDGQRLRRTKETEDWERPCLIPWPHSLWCPNLTTGLFSRQGRQHKWFVTKPRQMC